LWKRRGRGGAHQFRVVLGDHNQAESEGTERQSSVVRVVVHESYDEDTSDCDLALLRLNATQDFDCNVRPVCLPTDDVVVNTLCIATGWGSTRGRQLIGFNTIYSTVYYDSATTRLKPHLACTGTFFPFSAAVMRHKPNDDVVYAI